MLAASHPTLRLTVALDHASARGSGSPPLGPRSPPRWSPTCPSCCRARAWSAPTPRPTSTSTPGRLLRNATSLWDSDVALGTVTHQNIGYLWPMGPFYWVFETLGSPDWFAQRIWLGHAPLRRRRRACGSSSAPSTGRAAGMLVAVLAYELSPYLLDYSARISAVLLPWAGLPWIIALDDPRRPARTAGAHPALFALVVLTVGSRQRHLAPPRRPRPRRWLRPRTFVERSHHHPTGCRRRAADRRADVSACRSGGSPVSCSQGGYSLPVTRYTETYQTVASASTAPEVLPRARLLVLLRQRQVRSVDRAERRVHAGPLAALHQLRPRGRSRCSAPPWCGGVTAASSSS